MLGGSAGEESQPPPKHEERIEQEEKEAGKNYYKESYYEIKKPAVDQDMPPKTEAERLREKLGLKREKKEEHIE